MRVLICDRPPVTFQVGNEATRAAARNPRPNAMGGWPRSHLRSSPLAMQRLAGRSRAVISIVCAAAAYTTQCTRPGNDGGGGGAFSAHLVCKGLGPCVAGAAVSASGAGAVTSVHSQTSKPWARAVGTFGYKYGTRRPDAARRSTWCRDPPSHGAVCVCVGPSTKPNSWPPSTFLGPLKLCTGAPEI